MSIAPDEICRRLGESRCKEMFACLNTNQMKSALKEAGIPAVRQPGHTSVKRRNEDWATRLWRALPTGKDGVGTTLLYQWLSQRRNEMMATFLDLLEVPHKNGLTEEDFWGPLEDEKLHEAARTLLANEKFNRAEVAAYLLFLDLQYKTERFRPLELEQHLAAS